MLVIPDLIEPITGWRTWRASPHQGQHLLGSLVWKEVWLPLQKMRAECLRDARAEYDTCSARHFTSQLAESCSCGLYAFNSYERLLASGPGPKEHYRAPLWRSAIIHGEVALWGKVIRGEWGYRAQYGYPKRLMVHAYLEEDIDRCEQLAIELGKTYQVPSQLVIAT